MKRKVFIISICLCIITALCGCNLINYKSKKSNNFFYTEELINNLSSKKDFKLFMLDTNFYNKQEITGDGKEILVKFLSSLKKTQFTNKLPVTTKPQFKLFIEVDNNTYIINIYNNKYTTLHPWDGFYSPDIIDMSSTYTAYNLHNLCTYLESQ